LLIKSENKFMGDRIKVRIPLLKKYFFNKNLFTF
jgi:hypothetical protein